MAKEMIVEVLENLRAVTSYVNHNKIQKEDIVGLYHQEGEWFLLYYKVKGE